ncbi:S-type pyocin family protein [Brevundimonas sp.]|uniref:S-type pyocin family protein n=1 Tax=Brevundimonas sp. TaxID=1871086 RepID=UPI003561C48E
MRTLTRGGAALALCGLLGLSACDNSSAVETRDRTAEAAPSSGLMSETVETTTTQEIKPGLTVTRTETIDAKTARLFQRNGADFDAQSPQDYIAKVKAFTSSPPSDAETVKRPNGDTLIYQASTNTFAVVARNGSPRTMFKPTTGADYWAEQKAAAPTFGQRRQSTGAAG